ncbi:MAG TPA: prephenate dehydratase [Candidatus Limnocylindrales bacterium]|nr:prephenate dehydratase [Candidatus Limnocylindrales bacterium]
MTSPSSIAFQGEPGAFSEEAVIRFFGSADGATAVQTWRAVFETLDGGAADFGVVAIESSLAGTIRETYDLLFEYHDRIRIVGEVTVPVRLALLALPGRTIDDVERVYSHPQALAQADEFLRGRSWTVLTTYNTAGAAKVIAAERDAGAAAVASPRVADIYGLSVLAADIQTGSDNRTRFAVLAPFGAAASSSGGAADAAGRPMKTTLVFAVRNAPGSLHACLGAFASRGVNLSRLESRPSRAARWEYVFWVDLDADAADPVCAAALNDLRGVAAMVRVLGSYPRPAEE